MLDVELVEFDRFALALGRFRVQLDCAVMSLDLALVRCFRLGVGRVRRFFLRRNYPLARPLRPLVLPLGTCPGVRYTLLRPLHTSIFACLRHLGAVNASAARRLAVQLLRAGRSGKLAEVRDRGAARRGAARAAPPPGVFSAESHHCSNLTIAAVGGSSMLSS
jgi:hypothetical protein